MGESTGRARGAGMAALMNRIRAWRAGLGRPARGFVAPPRAELLGSEARGRQLLAGNLLMAGRLVEVPQGATPWPHLPADPAFAEAMHGFGWLDDLLAVPERAAERRARAWVHDWVGRYGRGRGPGWTPVLAGRRLGRLVAHGPALLIGADEATGRAFFATLTRHVRFLERCWHLAPPGLGRFEAVAGYAIGALALEGLDEASARALGALEALAATEIDPGGAIPSRNPEALAEVAALLLWVQATLEAGERTMPGALGAALARIAPTLLALRLPDGGLPRFHGGGQGAEGRIDAILALIAPFARARDGLAMGYARLDAGPTTLILDAAAPPRGEAGAEAHASTLGFELVSGRQRVIVSCGPGRDFGPRHALAGRRTAAHSTLSVSGEDSAEFVEERASGRLLLQGGPRRVVAETARAFSARVFRGAHDGWRHMGLAHRRRVELSADGRTLRGTDRLGAFGERDRIQLERHIDATGADGIDFAVRFHLHPEVSAALDLGGNAVSIGLRSGELWVLRPGPGVRLGLEPSTFYDHGRLRPRATKQVVLHGRLEDYVAEVGWTLTRAREGRPLAARGALDAAAGSGESADA